MCAKKLNVIRQSNKLVTASSVGENALTEYETKLYFYCIAKSGIEDKFYSVDAWQFVEDCGILRTSSMNMLRNTVLGLARKKVIFLGHAVPRFEELQIDDIEVRYKFSIELLEYINPIRREGNYSTYFLNEILSISGVNNLNLYLLVMKWRNVKQFSFTKEEYLRLMGKTSDNYSVTADFRRNLVKKPMEYLNKQKNLGIVLEVSFYREKIMFEWVGRKKIY